MPAFSPEQLAQWSGGAWTRRPAAPATGVSLDTRTLRPGDLFIALPGARTDGHAFVADALARGAAGVLVSAAFAAAQPAVGPLLAAADPARALRALAAGYRGTLRARFVAVTGSVGKTTVKELTADLLATRAPTARSRGNCNNDLGVPLSLLATEPDAAYGVYELGMSHPGELAPLCALVRPAAAIVTTIGAVHLEFFASVRAIAAEKAEVLRALPPDGLAVLAAGSEWFELLRAAAPCRVVTVALNAPADYTGRTQPGRPRAFTVTERAGGVTVALENALPGEHIVRNALLAIALARDAGADWDAIRQALRCHAPLPMRWEQRTLGGVAFINDAYNAGPLSMRAALTTLAQEPARGRKWLVLGGMRELGAATAAAHHELGREIAGGAWAGLITVGALGGLIAAGAAAGGLAPEQVVRCPDCAAAADELRRRVQPGDAVLVKASRGEELERVIQDLTAGPGWA
ncbi:MAG: UDP-N-acetylmuramoyl-tripeptide--D-alanyl-D-alanine ligase [Kiritimatiellaeota bacterium]|nr:UDP-N-acetylmuramoyl-tripeptide--D-alanyl-D-alanine ligase [Kiritimatiellota bacterium]